MHNPPDRRLLLRWAFDAIGFLLIFGHNFVIRSVLNVAFWAGLLFGERNAGYYLFMGLAHLYLIPTALLCWLTAFGMKRNKRWGLYVGVATCGLLLLGFPWLTLAGGLGLYFLFDTESQRAAAAGLVSTKPTTDFWISKRKSKAQTIAQYILWAVGFWLQGWFAIYARRAGMPAWHSGWTWWLWFSGFALLNTTFHETGHAVVAWAAGFKLAVFSVGPFTFVREDSRFRFRFDPAKLLESGGYIGAVPVDGRNLRANEIAVLAAGPGVNVLTCLVSLAIFFSLPGTAAQDLWWIAALNAMISCVMAVGNLIPLGYCDGTMLLHLILWSPAGQMLLDRKVVVQMGEESGVLHGKADFDGEIALNQAMLDRSLAFGQDNAFMIAACHQALGSAYALVDDWPAAEFHYRRCLEFDGEVANNPNLGANVWSGIHLTTTRRHHIAVAGQAYAAATLVLEKQKKGARGQAGPAITFAMLAQAHYRNGDLEAGLREIGEGLKASPQRSGDVFGRVHLLRLQALCRLRLGEMDGGLASARSCAELLRSPQIPPARRNLAWENVADLGAELWRTGQSAIAVEFLREGIAQMEEGGAATIAARYRIKLAACLRELGRAQEGFGQMPTEPADVNGLRRAFLAERAELNLATGRGDLAMADCRELLELWRANPATPKLEIACAEALFAKACLATGDFAGAEARAHAAADVLGPWQHPDAASCVVTIALVQSQARVEGASALVDEAFRLIARAPLLTRAEKARRKEMEAARIAQSARGDLVALSRTASV